MSIYVTPKSSTKYAWLNQYGTQIGKLLLTPIANTHVDQRGIQMVVVCLLNFNEAAIAYSPEELASLIAIDTPKTFYYIPLADLTPFLGDQQVTGL